MPVPGQRDLSAIEVDIAAAERARDDLLYSNDFAMTSGAYDRAAAEVLRLRRELTAAQMATIEQQSAEIVAAGQRMLAAAGLATAHVGEG